MLALNFKSAIKSGDEHTIEHAYKQLVQRYGAAGADNICYTVENFELLIAKVESFYDKKDFPLYGDLLYEHLWNLTPQNLQMPILPSLIHQAFNFIFGLGRVARLAETVRKISGPSKMDFLHRVASSRALSVGTMLLNHSQIQLLDANEDTIKQVSLLCQGALKNGNLEGYTNLNKIYLGMSRRMAEKKAFITLKEYDAWMKEMSEKYPCSTPRMLADGLSQIKGFMGPHCNQGNSLFRTENPNLAIITDILPWLTDAEMEAIARYLGMPITQLIAEKGLVNPLENIFINQDERKNRLDNLLRKEEIRYVVKQDNEDELQRELTAMQATEIDRNYVEVYTQILVQRELDKKALNAASTIIGLSTMPDKEKENVFNLPLSELAAKDEAQKKQAELRYGAGIVIQDRLPLELKTHILGFLPLMRDKVGKNQAQKVMTKVAELQQKRETQPLSLMPPHA